MPVQSIAASDADVPGGGGVSKKLREDPVARLATVLVAVVMAVAGASGGSWYFAPPSPISPEDATEIRREIRRASEALIEIRTQFTGMRKDINRLADSVEANGEAIQQTRERTDTRIREEIDRHARDAHRRP